MSICLMYPANAPIDPLEGCKGVWSCCQVNTLAPLLGIFCSEPPGECVGDEAPPRCLDVLTNRFGHCPANGGGSQGDGGGLKLGEGGLGGLLGGIL